jgi:hypothetical protein
MLAVACVLLVARYGHGAVHALVPRFAYVANNQDDTVSVFAIRGYRLRAVGYVYTGPGTLQPLLDEIESLSEHIREYNDRVKQIAEESYPRWLGWNR